MTTPAPDPHPMQPIVVDDRGVVRFKRNAVVEYLLDKGGIDLNHLWPQVAMGRLPLADYMQLMQLIGYSVSGYGDLAWSDGDRSEWEASAAAADEIADRVYAEWKAAHSDD